MSELTPETESAEQEASVEQEISLVALPGHRLKLKREDLHLSKDEVAHHLHLDVHIVDALESDNYGDLPSPAYICGYLRSYARILKLPEDEIVGAYSKGQEINAALIPESVSIEPKKQISPALVKFIAFIIIAVMFAGGFMWFAEKFHMFDTVPRTDSTTIEVPVPETSGSVVIERPTQVQEQIQQYNSETADVEGPETQEIEPPLLIDEDSSSVAAVVVAEQAQNGDLKLVFSKDSWAEVTDSEGKRHVYRLVVQETEIYVDGIAPYTILLGNAEGVDVFYKDKLFNHKRYQRDQIAYFRLGTIED